MDPNVEHIETRTADEFLSALLPSGRWPTGPTDWIFRGQSRALDPLLPAALRRVPCPRLDYTSRVPWVPSTHAEQIEAEYWALWDFFRVANNTGLAIPEDSQRFRSPRSFKDIIQPQFEAALTGRGPWVFDEMISLAALAQHYGVPTRLLDWSNRPLVAAYFAARGVLSGADGRLSRRSACFGVWCLNWRYVWKRWPGDNPRQIELMLVTAPRATNPNLHAQGGVFTLDMTGPASRRSRAYRKPLDDLIGRTLKRVGKIPHPVIRLITAPNSQAPRALRVLGSHGVTAATVFPGFHGVVRHLEEWHLWDRPPKSGELPVV